MFLLGTRNGLYITRPGDKSIEPLDTVPGRVTSLALTGSGRFFAVENKSRIVTGDMQTGGVTGIEEGLDHEPVCVATLSGEEVYVGTRPAAIYRLNTASLAWELVQALYELPFAESWWSPGGPAQVRSLAAHPEERNHLYADIHVGGIVRTEDSGHTWTPAPPTLEQDVHQVAVHAGRPAAVYAATADGFFYSPDEGDTWERRNDGLEHLYCRAIAIHPRAPDTVLISGSPTSPGGWGPEGKRFAIFRTENGGMSWTRVTEGLPPDMAEEVDTFCLAFSSLKPDRALCGCKDGTLYQSLDAGCSWSIVASDLPAIHCLGLM